MMSGWQPFWLVWCEDGGEPRAKHLTHEVALAEAKRLADRNPGHRFFVMRPVHFAIRQAPVVVQEITDDDMVPF